MVKKNIILNKIRYQKSINKNTIKIRIRIYIVDNMMVNVCLHPSIAIYITFKIYIDAYLLINVRIILLGTVEDTKMGVVDTTTALDPGLLHSFFS